MRKDDRGITLVELVIAIAAASVVFAAAVMFLGGAQRSYRMAEETINLQMEAQILMEQLGNWVMESNRIEVSGGGHVLVLYSIPRNNGRTETIFGDTSATKRVIWESGGKLYMVQKGGISDADHDTSTVDYTTESKAENCIGEYVFLFDLTSEAEDSPKVTILLGLREGDQEYSLTNDFTVRNEYLPKSASAEGLLLPATTRKGENCNA